jgi:hypothetical protein
MTHMHPTRSRAWMLGLLAGLAVTGVAVLPAPVLAQVGSGAPGQGLNTAANRRTPAALPTRPVPPPALPGAQPSGPGAPASRVPLDMPPTEALFDGVNRGDIETVRDALARGAELNARNILGITPTELAIDLGRNDIAFLLLSMRGADRNRNARRTTPAELTAPARPVAQATRPAPTTRATPVRTAAASSGPYANEPGVPAPSAGFLGFDERRVAR